MVLRPDMLLQTADILNVSVDEGEVGYDLGDVRDAAGIAQEAVSWGIDGFISMPNLPTGNEESARAMYLVDGDDKIVIATKDSRNSDKVGTLEPGDRAIISAGAQRFLMKQGNESISLYTENQATGSSMMVSLSGADGVATLVNGGSIVTMEDEKIVLAVNGGGYLEINKEGVFIQGKMFVATAGRGHFGVTPPDPSKQGVGYGAPGAPPVGVSVNWTVSP
jgi:hypothetical protein